MWTRRLTKGLLTSLTSIGGEGARGALHRAPHIYGTKPASRCSPQARGSLVEPPISSAHASVRTNLAKVRCAGWFPRVIKGMHWTHPPGTPPTSANDHVPPTRHLPLSSLPPGRCKGRWASQTCRERQGQAGNSASGQGVMSGGRWWCTRCIPSWGAVLGLMACGGALRGPCGLSGGSGPPFPRTVCNGRNGCAELNPIQDCSIYLHGHEHGSALLISCSA
jgi:hypothetical protein